VKREVLYTLVEAQVIIEACRRYYNTIRPHSALGYQPPAPEAILPRTPIWPALPMGSGQVSRDQKGPAHYHSKWMRN